MRHDFLVFGAPKIEQPEIDEVIASMTSGWIGTGPKTHRFEEMFREYKGVSHAIAVNSCTAALHLSLIAIGIEEGDEVIVPSMTFAATANAVFHAGGTPVFADCHRSTMTLDPDDVARKITTKTKAIVPVHFAGRMCDMDAIMSIARRHNLKVIEDCAHAIETEYNGKKAGTYGDLACFSFYVTKNIVTGEGGMVITNNASYANTLKIFALHGMSRDAWKRFGDDGYKHYEVLCSGFKYNMMDIQAAMGIQQLPRIDTYHERRCQIWDMYNKAFKGLPVSTPATIDPGMRHARHLYTLLVDQSRVGISRDHFLREMTRRNIGVGVHYLALHLQPFYRKTLGTRQGDLPNAEWVSERTVSLPLSARLTDEDVMDVVHAVTDIVGHALRAA